jgi:hypothetical protein
MTNFQQLSQEEYQIAWDRFYALFHFKPDVKNFPAVESGKPSLTFTIRDFLSPGYVPDELEKFAIQLFRGITKPGERLYALDWQHPCYDFDPRKEMDRDEFDEWIVPVVPNGDYYIFLTKDFTNIWFGHPWEETITLIGNDIVNKAEEINPIFLKIKQ